tara:strand:- start:136148 stop:136462 length:315 start_codon:yes stop_codon:yes gene_type:complete
MEYAKSEGSYINKYQKLGYTANYQLKNDTLVDMETKKSYSPNKIYITKEFRFEGMSNPSDMSILYIIETKDGSKGTVLANYSPSSDIELAEFFSKIPKENFNRK